MRLWSARLLLILLWPVIGEADEIAPFKLTSIDGHVLIDYLSDELSASRTDQLGDSDQLQSILREEIFLATKSYVYHPNFLTLDIGGGPIRQDTSIDFSGSQEDTGDNLFNFTGRANFLQNKPVRGSLFYDHLNPTISVAPGEVMTQENSRYGFDFSAANSRLGLPVDLGYVRSQTQGRSDKRTQDDTLDQFYVDTSRSLGKWGTTSLRYGAIDQSSRSGSLDLPVQKTQSKDQDINANTRLQFGDRQEYNLVNNITYITRNFSQAIGDLPDQSNFGFLLDFRGLPVDKLNLFGTFLHNRNDQGVVDLVNQSLSSGLTYAPQANLESSIGFVLENSDADQYTIDTQAVDGSLLYNHALWLGEFQASYSSRYELRDQQEGGDPLVAVIDEQHTLTGTTPVPLNRAYVQDGSVVVTNLTQSQTFIENVDYSLVVIGTETRIQRLASGSILDGEEILVDYIYDIGGTYASNQLDQTLSLSWRVSRYFSTYVRWYNSSPDLTSGFSTYPLNTVDSMLLGMDGELPMPFNIPFSVGGSTEYEDRNELISPYKRTAWEVFLQSNGPIFGLANVRLSERSSQITYDFSDQDIDLTGYEVRLWTRRFGIELNAVLNYEEDIGSPIHRSRRDASLNAIWRERKVTVIATILNTIERQGDFDRDHFLIRLTARRDF